MTQKGKDTLKFIESLQDKGLTSRQILDETALFTERWEENQLPEGIIITTNSFGLPEIKIK
tara:strand:+ start:327 stop:509 length:183 start_codon:yes stop_codon:yes gene_type:complete